MAVVNRKEAPDKISLSGKLGREISNVIVKHKVFFDGFDKIIVYYDNGQIEFAGHEGEYDESVDGEQQNEDLMAKLLLFSEMFSS